MANKEFCKSETPFCKMAELMSMKALTQFGVWIEASLLFSLV